MCVLLQCPVACGEADLVRVSFLFLITLSAFLTVITLAATTSRCYFILLEGSGRNLALTGVLCSKSLDSGYLPPLFGEGMDPCQKSVFFSASICPRTTYHNAATLSQLCRH